MPQQQLSEMVLDGTSAIGVAAKWPDEVVTVPLTQH